MFPTPSLPAHLLPIICEELIMTESGRTMVNLSLTCRVFSAVILPLLPRIPYNISTWYPKQTVPLTQVLLVSFSSPVSRDQVGMALRNLDSSRPLFGRLDALTICPTAVAGSDVPARYLAHYITAFVHPRKILIKTSSAKVELGDRQKLVWLIRDLRKVCRGA